MVEGPVALTWPARLPSAGSIHLRRFHDDDLGLVEALGTDPYVPTIGTVPAVWSPAAGRAFIARQHGRTDEGLGFSMVIARLSDDLGIGTAGLWLDHKSDVLARVGYTIAPGHRGHGYAAMALRALVAMAWERPKLRRLEAHIEPWNVASVRTAERVGFVFAGLLPDAEVAGRRTDLDCYALTRGGEETEPRS